MGILCLIFRPVVLKGSHFFFLAIRKKVIFTQASLHLTQVFILYLYQFVGA